MLTIPPNGAAGATMTSEDDTEACHQFALACFPKVSPDIASMSREELAVILHGLACKAQVIQASWSHRKSYVALPQKSSCPEVSRIFAAMEDYMWLSEIEDARWLMDTAPGRIGNGRGCVYVIEFDDGHVKIGKSVAPEQRIKSLVGGNQAQKLRTWISERIDNPMKLERQAHSHFQPKRVGGEFFRVDFDSVVAWISGVLSATKIAINSEVLP